MSSFTQIRKDCEEITKGTTFFNRLYKAAKKAYYETPKEQRKHFRVKRYEKEQTNSQPA